MANRTDFQIQVLASTHMYIFIYSDYMNYIHVSVPNEIVLFSLLIYG